MFPFHSILQRIIQIFTRQWSNYSAFLLQFFHWWDDVKARKRQFPKSYQLSDGSVLDLARSIRQASNISIYKSWFHLQNSCQFYIVWTTSIGCWDHVLDNHCCFDCVNHWSDSSLIVAMESLRPPLLRWFALGACCLRVQHGSHAQSCEMKWLDKGKQSFQHINAIAAKPCRLSTDFGLESRPPPPAMIMVSAEEDDNLDGWLCSRFCN